MSSDEEDDKETPEEPESEKATEVPPKESYHLVYLHSWPLVGQRQNDTEKFIIKKLDFEREKELLIESLQRTGKAIKVSMEVATAENLRLYVTEGCRALHYTGHGLKNCLAFEDDNGKMHAVDPELLKDLVSAGGGAQRIKFVLVSACHSESAGNAFVKAGVPHVIAVRSESQIQDKSSNIFMRHLYTSLWSGYTVQAAFDVAVQAVQAAPSPSPDEHNQFLLLPKGGNHNVKIFEDLEKGQWEDLGPKESASRIPVLTGHFQGRNLDMQPIIAALRERKKRFITITGEQGIGKTTLAIAAARYCHERRFFSKGVFFVELERLGSDETIASRVSQDIIQARNAFPFKLCKTAHELSVAIGDDQLLLVLDGAHAVKGGPKFLTTFIGELLRNCGKIKVLVTSRVKMGACEGVGETYFELNPLSPLSAAQLFWDLSPRTLTLMDIGCTDPRKSGTHLSEHKVLKMLNGNPGHIFDAVQLLSPGCKLDDLPAKILEQAAERKRQADLLEKLAKMPTPGSDSDGVTAGHDEEEVDDEEPPPPSRSQSQSRISRSLSRIPTTPPPASSSGIVRSHSALPSFFPSPSPPPKPAPPTDEWVARFGQTPAVPWTEFKRFISEYFVVVGKVDYRPLSETDLQFIKEKAGAGGTMDTVTYTGFRTFWPWFTATVVTVALVRSEWCKDRPRLIHGFISKDHAAYLLKDKPVGTFVLRFSDSRPGQIAVCHVEDDTKLPRHTLIEIEDEKFVMRVESSQAFHFSSLTDLILQCKPLMSVYPGIEKGSAFGQEDEDDDVPH